MPAKILVVDDEVHVTRLVQINLQRAGYEVVTALDGVAALEMVRQDPPTLVMTDITMPRMDGIELLRRLKADPATADIPVILLTAKSQDADIFEGKRSGAVWHLSKPFSPRQLLDAVQETLASPPPPAE